MVLIMERVRHDNELRKNDYRMLQATVRRLYTLVWNVTQEKKREESGLWPIDGLDEVNFDLEQFKELERKYYG